MASSGKQAFVGRRERTSLKAPAGEATLTAVQYAFIFRAFSCPYMVK